MPSNTAGRTANGISRQIRPHFTDTPKYSHNQDNQLSLFTSHVSHFGLRTQGMRTETVGNGIWTQPHLASAEWTLAGARARSTRELQAIKVNPKLICDLCTVQSSAEYSVRCFDCY